MTRGRTGAALAALAVGLTVGWHFATGRSGGRVADTPPAVDPAPTEPPWVEGIGYVEPRSEVRRLAFKTGGVIRRCGPKPGDFIPAGEVIAELDDAAAAVAVTRARRQLELAVAQAADVKAGTNPYRIRASERTVEKLRERARHLRSEANRLEKLLLVHSVSHSERDEAATKALQGEIDLREQEAELLLLQNIVVPEQRAVADARVRLAEADLLDAEQRLADTRLVAPFGGVVLRYLKREGEGVSPLMPPEPVVVFGDLTRRRVRAEIDERYVRRLAFGQKAEVYGRNLGNVVHAGSVVEVEQVLGDKTVFTRSSAERKDLQVLQVVIEMGEDFAAPVGLQVDVRVRRADDR
jgi:multidrug resistance efflux pump